MATFFMGPIALFDKSFLQSLTVDESVWFDHFFYSNICPLFYVETLADLTKGTTSTGRTAEDTVRIIADKTPVLGGAPCVHHRELVISNLMGQSIPMNGQIPRAGGRPVRSANGKRGLVFDESPEAKAFARWQQQDFQEVERAHARGWREMLTNLDLPATSAAMRALGINSRECKTVEQAHCIAMQLVHGRTLPFEQMALLFSFLYIPPDLQRLILQRWAIDQNRPLGEYAPYAAHVLVVEIFFQIALAASLISDGRASNRVDISYLCYLPFSMVFISSDKLHKKCAGVFLRKNQDFVWGPDLKSELARQNTDFGKLPQEVLETGLMKFAGAPLGEEGSLLITLWDRHMRGWRKRDENSVSLTPEAEKRLIEEMKALTKAPMARPSVDEEEVEVDQMAIQRLVPKRKGNWWLLPKDLKANDDDEPIGA
ncbi:hypothetical protein LNV08_22310 [Paucibacter sp. TC2R-5]|uniref:hypothetical protein n=1 Tax=Paucibacter sp. TC2R-5 TaxID=2893555 RepID=UPI0021E38E0D|nr:hypothetical protein [Paucibacter sp. TC2R-5]MCV2361704.1 hypothetical protein [Paucibacter sp. TC2R-5]